MRNHTEYRTLSPYRMGLVALAACTLWLVIQNTLLLMAVLWTEPHRALVIGSALFKATAALMVGFWTSPAAVVLVVGALVVTAIATPALHTLAAGPARGEVHHGL